MKKVLLVALVALLLVAPAFAYGEYAGNITKPHWFNISSAEASALCVSHGTTWDPSKEIRRVSYNSGWGFIGAYGGVAWYSFLDNYWGGGDYYLAHEVTCANSTSYIYRYYMQGTSWPVMANFTASPTSGASALYVIFSDTSTNTTGIATYNWSISPVTGWMSGNLTSKDMTASFTTPGNYTISHGASNGDSSDIETKTNYITVYNATSDYITTGFAAMDEPRWIQLAGSSIYLNDVENGTWKNITTSATGYEEITTLSNHTINAYASLAGYGDADLLAKPAWNGGVYQILMLPVGYGNVSAGNVTLYVNVWAGGTRLSGATVNMAYMSGGSQINNYATTGSGGTATFIVPNKTTIYLYGEKVGYSRGGTTVYSGTGDGGSSSVSADITLVQNAVTPTATITTLPGGGTPTPTVTILPYCDKSKSDYDESKCRSSHGNYSLNILAEYMDDLVMLCIFVTIMYLLGFKLGR